VILGLTRQLRHVDLSDPDLLRDLQRDYDRGAFLTAWQRLKDFEPPEQWTDPSAHWRSALGSVGWTNSATVLANRGISRIYFVGSATLDSAAS
jgi:hypothetical protein